MKLVCSTACSFHLTFWVSVSVTQIKEEAILTVYSERQRWGKKQMRRETDRERERDFMLKVMVQAINTPQS